MNATNNFQFVYAFTTEKDVDFSKLKFRAVTVTSDTESSAFIKFLKKLSKTYGKREGAILLDHTVATNFERKPILSDTTKKVRMLNNLSESTLKSIHPLSNFDQLKPVIDSEIFDKFNGNLDFLVIYANHRTPLRELLA